MVKSRTCYLKGVFTSGGVERRNGDDTTVFPFQNISHGHMYIINNNRALFIARYVLLVVKQEI